MPRRAVRLSRTAQNWLRKEIAYLIERSPAAAQKAADRIRKARELLVEHPRSARVGIIPGTRRLVVGAYVLTIREKNGATEIAAIRHARQADARAPRELVASDEADPFPVEN